MRTRTAPPKPKRNRRGGKYFQRKKLEAERLAAVTSGEKKTKYVQESKFWREELRKKKKKKRFTKLSDTQ